MHARIHHKLINASLALLLCCRFVTAQLPDHQVSLLQEQDGLKTSDVVAMARDQQGYLWLASQSFIQRFDGKHTLHFTFSESVTSIHVDSEDRKWATTRAGVYMLDTNNRTFKRVPVDSTDNENLLKWYEFKGKGIFVFNAAGHYRYDNKSARFLPGLPTPDLSKTRIFNHVEEAGNNHVFTSRDFLFLWDSAAQKYSSTRINSIYSVIAPGNNFYLVSTYGYKTYSFYKGKLLPVKLGNETADQSDFLLNSSVAISDSQHLLSSNRGFLIINNRTGEITKPSFYYNGRPLENQSSAIFLYKDSSGTIYMNHAEGVFLMNNRSNFFRYLRNYQSGDTKLPGNDVRNFAEDEQGYIWMATINGIVRMEPHTGNLKAFDPSRLDNGIDFPSYRQLLCDGPYVWIGTSGNGVWVYDKRTAKYMRPVFSDKEEETGFNRIYTWRILKLQNAEMLIIGGSRSYIVNPANLKARRISYSSAAYNSRSAVQDVSGRIWHGSVRGLTCMDTSFNTLFYVRDSFPDQRIASFCEWKKDHMLVGSKGMFELKVEGNKLISFTPKKGIPRERLIYCMRQDRQGFVWVGTDDGLFRYDPVKDEAIAFDASDHIQSQAFNSDAAFLSSSGWLFVGGKNGVNYFKPENFQYEEQKLFPRIVAVSLSGNDTSYINTNAGATVEYGNRNVDFIISAPEFGKPYRLRYRYRLQTGDKDWVYTGFNNRIRISNLQPGKYWLQVAASYDGTKWFDGKDLLSFRVNAPWWQTTWFRSLCVLLGILTLFGIRSQLRKRREEKQLKRTIDYFKYSTTGNASTEIILWDIARNCISGLGLEDCVIYLVDEEKQLLVQKAAIGDKNPGGFEIANPIVIPIGKGITGEVAKTGKPLIVANTASDNRYIVDDKRRASEIAVPIIHEGKIIGVLDSEHHRKNFFKHHHLRALETISTLCAGKIATAIALEATKKAEAELTLLNSKMLESKFLNLRLQMNPHFLFNILTSIQYLVVSGQVNKATTYLNTFSGFLRSLLNFAEDTVVTLEDELTILGMYVELESLCVDETFIWETVIDEEVDREEVWVPFMLLQPFVENSINHGLINKIGEKRFRISITSNDEDSLLCTIEDNGIGRVAAGAISAKNLSNVLHQSKGMLIVEERLKLLQQKTSKPAGFEIEDLYNSGEPCGTRIRILIPYYSNQEI